MAYGVEYKRDEFQLPALPKTAAPTGSKFGRWIIKNSGGFIKSEKQANYLLTIVVILSTIIWVLLFLSLIYTNKDIDTNTSDAPPAATFNT